MTPGIILFWHFVFAFVGMLIGIVIGYQWMRRSRQPVQMLPPPEPRPAQSIDPSVVQAGWSGDGRIWLEMNGVHVVNRGELNPEQQKRLAALVQSLSPWVEAVKPVESVPTPVPAASRKTKAAEKKEAPAAPTPAMESIIQQINRVLQAKLAASAFKDRGVQLLEGPGGAVIVEDGLNSYEGIDSVPDDEIKTLIRASVSEWEKSK